MEVDALGKGIRRPTEGHGGGGGGDEDGDEEEEGCDELESLGFHLVGA